VTTETTAGQDRLHILIEIETSCSVRAVASDYAHCENHNDQTKTKACGIAGIRNRLLGTITTGCGM